MTAPRSNDVLADIAYYLNGASRSGADRAYMVRQGTGVSLLIAVTDLDSMERSDWTLVLHRRVNAPDPFGAAS